jgi:rubrerythrin
MEILLRNDKWEFSFKVNEKTGDMLLKNPKYASAILESINKEHNTDFTVDNSTLTNITGKHICKYCGNIVEGEYEDLLCDECREIFGHSLYSEL